MAKSYRAQSDEKLKVSPTPSGGMIKDRHGSVDTDWPKSKQHAEKVEPCAVEHLHPIDRGSSESIIDATLHRANKGHRAY